MQRINLYISCNDSVYLKQISSLLWALDPLSVKLEGPQLGIDIFLVMTPEMTIQSIH
jgi:hypothetical protein